MTEQHNFEITKNNETRITEALESIANSLKTLLLLILEMRSSIYILFRKTIKWIDLLTSVKVLVLKKFFTYKKIVYGI